MIRALAAVLCLACGAARAGVAEHAIEAHLAPASGELRVVDEIRVDGLARFAFRLADWLVIERLAVNGRPGAAPRAPNGEYALALPDAGPHLLRFELRGAVPLRDESPAAASGTRSSSGADGTYLPGFAAWVPVEASEDQPMEDDTSML